MRDIFDELPDRRIELIDGQFIVGANLEGSRRMLKVLLESWGGNAALSLTPTVTPWIKALNLAYGFSYSTDQTLPVADLLKTKTIPAKTTLMPKIGDDFQPLSLAGDLHMAIFSCRGLESFGRDFVTKLGPNALTPNGMIIHDQKHTLYEYYLDGPPDIVFEFVWDEALLTKHFDIYLHNGISELWVFNVKTGQIRTSSFGFDKYTKEFSGAYGLISSTAIPVLQIEVQENWQQRKYGDKPFRVVSSPTQEGKKRRGSKEGVRWDSLVFAPILDLEPFPITFDEFISWTGETKFESYDEGRISVGTPDGTRPIFGQLLMTFGLIEAVKLMPPAFWMNAINERLEQLNRQEDLRQKMWQSARQAAQLLHDKFNLAKIAVVGDLINDAPLGLWSRVTLVFPEEERRNDDFEIYQALEIEDKVDTYSCDDYIPLEIRNTFDKMVFI